MGRANRRPLADRVIAAAEAALSEAKYASFVDVLLRLRWLDPNTHRRWRLGGIDSLEAALQTNPARIAEALALFRSWAGGRGLIACEAQYVARTPERKTLRFGRSADPAVEREYRTHWLSPDLSEKRRARLVEKARRAPDLVVIDPLNRNWTCHRCGGTGGLLVMENAGPACPGCVGLGDLEFLPAGNALLTRRAKAKSARSAVVVRFSRSRRRYERQGLLVERQALEIVRRELARS
jgi:hypothetical protein